MHVLTTIGVFNRQYDSAVMYERFQGGVKLGPMMPRDANNNCKPLKPAIKLLAATVGAYFSIQYIYIYFFFQSSIFFLTVMLCMYFSKTLIQPSALLTLIIKKIKLSRTCISRLREPIEDKKLKIRWPIFFFFLVL